MKPRKFFKLVLILPLALTGCSGGKTRSAATPTQPVQETAAPPSLPAATTLPVAEDGAPAPAGFTLTSSVFQPDGQIPVRYTCDGEDLSPPLAWQGAPASTQSFALILDDPDAPGGTFTHWVLFDLPSGTTELAEDASSDAALAAHQGKTSWRKAGYGGPCPPSGTHHYVFTLYALDSPLKLSAGASKKELLSALEGHVLAQTKLTGLYSR